MHEVRFVSTKATIAKMLHQILFVIKITTTNEDAQVAHHQL